MPVTRLSQSVESKSPISGLTDSGSRIVNDTPFHKKKPVLLGLLTVVLILGSVAAYVFFIRNSNIVSPTADQISRAVKEIKNNTVNSGVYENPVNGLKISEEEAAKFKDKKPIAVMVNNYVDARPTIGLTSADIVYEAVAEGGITRLMPIFYSKIPPIVESIRSARYYFAQLASSYKAHYIHWGLAHMPDCQKLSTKDPKYCGIETDPRADVKDAVAKLGIANLDGGNYACERSDCEFGRDPARLGKVASEHTALVRLPLIYDLAKKIRPEDSWHKFVEFKKWQFKEDADQSARGDIGASPVFITYNYWDTMAGFNVKWEYDKTNNEYIRYQGDVKQLDGSNQKELRAKVVIIRFTKQEPANDKKHHLLTYLDGKGAALIFQDGQATKGFWDRKTIEDMDVYTDENGKEIAFNRGQIWVQLVPQGNEVKYTKDVQKEQKPSTNNKNP